MNILLLIFSAAIIAALVTRYTNKTQSPHHVYLHVCYALENGDSEKEVKKTLMKRYKLGDEQCNTLLLAAYSNDEQWFIKALGR